MDYTKDESSESARHYLIILTSLQCHNCITFKQRYREDLLSKIREANKIEIIEIESPTNSRSVGGKYHPDLPRWIGWFPEFILFTHDTWEDTTSALQGEIMNGELKPGKDGPDIMGRGGGISSEHILEWIETQLISNPLFLSIGKSSAKYQSPKGSSLHYIPDTSRSSTNSNAWAFNYCHSNPENNIY